MSRAPELRPGLRNGLGIPDARGWRLRVDDDGALLLTEPGRAPRVLTSVGRVTRAVWVTPEEAARLLGRRFDPATRHSGGVVLLEEGTPVVSFFVEQFTPWAGDLGERREQSGAVALVRGLGLVLERAEASDHLEPRAVRRVRVILAHGSPLVLAASVVLCVVGGVLAFLTWPYGGSPAGAWLGAAALLVTLPVMAWLVASRRRFLELVTTPPDADGRAVYRSSTRQPAVPSAVPQLQLGAEDVVIADGGGVEHWLPGPALGGACTCVVGADDVQFLDRSRRVLQALSAAAVVPDPAARERLAAACASAGIAFEHFGLPNATANLATRWRYDRTWPPGLMMSEWERGDLNLFAPYLTLAVALILLPGAIAAAVSAPPWGFLVLAGSLGLLAARAWTGVTVRRWRRRVITQGAQ